MPQLKYTTTYCGIWEKKQEKKKKCNRPLETTWEESQDIYLGIIKVDSG